MFFRRKTNEPKHGTVLTLVLRKNCCTYVSCIFCFIVLGKAKVSKAEVCRIATAFCSELSSSKTDIESQSHPNAMKRLDEHWPFTPDCSQSLMLLFWWRLFKKSRSVLTKGLNQPVLPSRNAVQRLSERGKLRTLLGDCFFARWIHSRIFRISIVAINQIIQYTVWNQAG